MSTETLDTDLIPWAIGEGQIRAGTYEDEGKFIRARQQFGALLNRTSALAMENERLRDLVSRAAGVLRSAGMPMEADVLEAQLDVP